MALTLPTPEELENHQEEMTPETALQRAADLLTIATGLDATPTDPLPARIAKTAILDMARFLIDDHDNFAARTSPFSSERIGSYSYAKMQERLKLDPLSGTGVPGFDQAVDYFRSLEDSIISTTSQWVFLPEEQLDLFYNADGVSLIDHDPGSFSLFPDMPYDRILVAREDDITVSEDGFPILIVEP